MALEGKKGGSVMAPEEEALKGTEWWHKVCEFTSGRHFSPDSIRRDTAKRTTGLASCRFISVLMLTFLLKGCGFAEDPCTQHVGTNGTEPYYYYTGDCGEGVTAANTKQPSDPYIIQFDNSFLNSSGAKTKN